MLDSQWIRQVRDRHLLEVDVVHTFEGCTVSFAGPDREGVSVAVLLGSLCEAFLEALVV